MFRPSAPPPVGSAEFQAQLAEAGEVFRTAGVRYLYLMHGTFAGNDALGLFGEIARFFPEIGQSLRSLGKATFDRLIGEVGNYTADFAERLQGGLNRPRRSPPYQEGAGGGSVPPADLEVHTTSSPIEVRRFCWSSENHHIARADAAIRLLDELSMLAVSPGERILVWGHSHAGNVLALLTNLLAADEEARGAFFKAAERYYRAPVWKSIDLPAWPRVQERLDRDNLVLRSAGPDVVTFGTPVRYGWDTAGYRRLMHVVHHHPRDGLPDHQAAFPPATKELLSGHGDFIQQMGIAGTDFPPGPIVWRSWVADARLARLLAPDMPRSGLLARLRLGQRVHDDGATLLVDYGPQGGTPAQHFFGHGVYTQTAWMAFHAQQTARVLYNQSNPPVPERSV